MNNEVAWNVAAVPVVPWAMKVFPDLEAGEAVERTSGSPCCGLVVPISPIRAQAWTNHDQALKKVSAFMERHQVRAMHLPGPAKPGPVGKPTTDLYGRLDRAPQLDRRCVAQHGPGHPFFANIPTEESFSTPHRGR